MKWLVMAALLIFAALHLIAAVAQLRGGGGRATAWTMLAGGAILALGALLQGIGWRFDWTVVAAGASLICAAAVCDGRRSGHLHPSHHVVRIALAALLLAGTVLW